MTDVNPDTASPPAYRLADVEARAQKNPKFEIPSRQDRESLEVGQWALLVFSEPPDPTRQIAAERHWVEVTATARGRIRIVEDGVASGGDIVRYVGIVATKPTAIEGLRRGDVVRFEPQHVAKIDGRKG